MLIRNPPLACMFLLEEILYLESLGSSVVSRSSAKFEYHVMAVVRLFGFNLYCACLD